MQGFRKKTAFCFVLSSFLCNFANENSETIHYQLNYEKIQDLEHYDARSNDDVVRDGM